MKPRLPVNAHIDIHECDLPSRPLWSNNSIGSAKLTNTYPVWFLVLILIAAPCRGQNFGTQVAAVYTPTEVVIAAESLVTNRQGEIITSRYCKIRRFGAFYVAIAGL